MSEPRLREAAPDDLAAICRLGADVNRMHHDAWPEIFAGPGDPMRDAAHWQRSIAAADATTFVAELDGAVVGFATVFVVQDASPLLQPRPYARVGSVCVDAAWRGRGIGRALMHGAEAWALGRGVVDMRLNVWVFNQRALALYRELGYAPRSQVLGKRLDGSLGGPPDGPAGGNGA